MKRRNREVNIFNMSLLDILCGALGAFCFMMLSLLPYYRPPGKDITVSKEQKDLLDEVQKIKDLAERLKNTSTAEDQRELVKLLREQIAILENQIKQLQGRVNTLLAENDSLKQRIDGLDRENQQLHARNQQIEQEKQQLVSEKQQLERERQKLQNQIQQKLPWTITMFTNNTPISLDCSLHEQIVTTEGGQRQGDYDPALAVQPGGWTGDSRIASAGRVTRVNADRAVGSEGKLYVSMSAPPGQKEGTPVFGNVEGFGLTTFSLPPLELTRERPWMLVGRLRIESLSVIKFTAATQAERDAEWERLTKTKAPKTDETELTDAVMGPGFERRKKEYETMTGGNAPKEVRVALLVKWQAEAQSAREREYVDRLLARITAPRGGPGPFPFPSNDARGAVAATKRRVEYSRAVREAQTQDEKTGILRKWMNEADSDAERDQVRAMLQQATGAAAPGPKSDRQRAIEEYQKQQQNQQPQPKPQ